ncbi:hypothetical protein M9Y10_041400 [Tritrichomonas musculus]|uniref:Homeobox domain-containing protein n=1 Tax=Tritrichomonas musculus TaxID=1915356 RepID=A0ABR2K489_9EUKA
MMQHEIKNKRSRHSLLPSNEPVTMHDRYKSFYDQYMYEVDFDPHSENCMNTSKRSSVCAIWPRPRFMLQINTPMMGNRQSFYPNNYNLMPTVNVNNTTAPIIYQKRKYHTKKDLLNEESFNKNNYTLSQNNYNPQLNLESDNNGNVSSLSFQQSDPNFNSQSLQIKSSQFPKSNSNAIDFISISNNNPVKEEQNLLSDHDNKTNMISDQNNTSVANKSQPQISYINQQHQQQQLLAKKMKEKIIQHPLNVPGIQFALQHQEQLMQMSNFQKLQQIQQMQRLQSKNKNKKTAQKDPNETYEAEENIKNVNENDKLAQPVQNEILQKKKCKPRQNFSPQQKMLLEKFIYDHIDHPYAENKDLIMLEKQTNLSRKQIRVYMTNARMRKFAGNKIPVLKKSGNIVMRKGVPLQGPLPRVDAKSQQYIQCYPKKMNSQPQIPVKLLINQSDSTTLNKANESNANT